MLELRDIKKTYLTGQTEVHALRGIDLSFRQNEFVSVLGPSGCGKTTLLNIIGGLDQYTSGDLVIQGRSTKDFKDSDWDAYRNRSIGFVFQTYNLIPHQTVLGNVELALTLSGMPRAKRRALAVEALTRVGLADQIHKRPNQLSGGQMQRVAIARAIVNRPKIILADEPTGALDSEISVQVMDLLKEIAGDKLVVMVTHNADIAIAYSSRIIRLTDGCVSGDTNPYYPADDTATEAYAGDGVATEGVADAPYLDANAGEASDADIADASNVSDNVHSDVVKPQKKDKTSMSFFTALALSGKNLLTKKARTILTAFAGSIGIIGIALVLAISSGFQAYIDQMQADTMSSYPLEISETAYDIDAAMGMMSGGGFGGFGGGAGKSDELTEFPDEPVVNVNKTSERFDNIVLHNTLSDKYITNVIEPLKKDGLVNDISYTKAATLNVFLKDGLDQSGSMTYTPATLRSWGPLLTNREFVNSQYDLIDGTYPQSKEDMVLVLDSYNRVSDNVLRGLGLYDEEQTTVSFADIFAASYKLYLNESYYVPIKDASGNITRWSINPAVLTGATAAVELKISGIVRVKPGVSSGALSSSIGYLPELVDYILAEDGKPTTSLNETSMVQWIKDNPYLNPLSGAAYPEATKEASYKTALQSANGDGRIIAITLYPKDFDAKEKIKERLNAYNKSVPEEEKVFFNDMIETMMSTITTMVNAIKYILIAFTAISLVVSSIMIGIITYISVLERTKEIGVLRSIGARKRDISRVFNAETLTIGFISGMIGVIVTLLLSIPINLIINNLAGVANVASLQFVHAIILIAVSMALTFIAGLIPSRVAAKKDPVTALRTE
ncbi:MAG: ATP-binding cassette domain-containing protein [Clostridiaceae bacterium]|nr:ATP-binding cassette domain-containing protein [Clostridiaceae bacterium]